MANVNNGDNLLDWPAEAAATAAAIGAAAKGLNDHGMSDVDLNENGEIKSDRPKHNVKLTSKALCEKNEKLQSTRKAKLNKASNLKKIVRELMTENDCEPEVKCTFAKFVDLWDEVKSLHNSLMGLLNVDELERQQTRFNA